ncbi:MAG: sigma-54-dependent Fis family transcriptional regulator [Deltaproteobacteria bacterium]|nr:sigma-54-dependent Fis family transcriptional regulator [Deltaproteobacteria bacterium]
MSERILFADDDLTGRELSIFNLTEAGYAVDAAPDGKQALSLFSPERHHLVITDLRMPKLSGMELVAEVRRQAPEVPIIVITAHGSVEAAVEAMQAGAYDFLQKPFGRDELLLAASRALERRRLGIEVRALRLRAAGIEREIVAVSEPMQGLLRTVDRVARSEASVLITGESGTGKELVARRIHSRSPRAEKPFVAVNCASMPAELLESELFGHEKGAYTGAVRARAGRFRKAEGGTLLLDEIGEMSPALQSKLLRALQERVIDVLGSDHPVPINVRVVAATHQELPRLIETGAFREDLYYRLNVVELNVPPLRSRPEDVEPLARHFLQRIAPDRELQLSDELLRALRRYPWPGNVRELENVCERLVILSEDELRTMDLPPAFASSAAASAHTSPSLEAWPPFPPEGISLVDLERRVIERALDLKGGNISQAAQFLHIPRHILVYRLEKFGLRRGKPERP